MNTIALSLYILPYRLRAVSELMCPQSMFFIISKLPRIFGFVFPNELPSAVTEVVLPVPFVIVSSWVNDSPIPLQLVLYIEALLLQSIFKHPFSGSKQLSIFIQLSGLCKSLSVWSLTLESRGIAYRVEYRAVFESFQAGFQLYKFWDVVLDRHHLLSIRICWRELFGESSVHLNFLLFEHDFLPIFADLVLQVLDLVQVYLEQVVIILH